MAARQGRQGHQGGRQGDPRGLRPGGLVQWVSLLIAALLAAIAFLTSFEGLSDLARTHQAYPDGWQWVLPTLVDGMAIVAGLVWYVRHVHGERPGYAAWLVVIAAAASVGANMTHAPVGCSGGCTMAAAEVAARAAQGAEQVNVALSKLLAGLPPISFGLVWHLIQDEMARRRRRTAAREQAAEHEQTALEAAAERERQAREEAAQQAAARQRAEEEAAQQAEAIQAETSRQLADAEQRIAKAIEDATRAAAARDLIEQQAAQQLETLKGEARRHLDAMQATVQQVQEDARREVEAARADAARQVEAYRQQADGHRQELAATRTRRAMPAASAAGPRRSGRRSEEIQASLEAAYATNPDPAGWTKRSLAEATTEPKAGETAARLFLARKRAELAGGEAPVAEAKAEGEGVAAAAPGRELMRVAS